MAAGKTVAHLLAASLREGGVSAFCLALWLLCALTGEAAQLAICALAAVVAWAALLAVPRLATRLGAPDPQIEGARHPALICACALALFLPAASIAGAIDLPAAGILWALAGAGAALISANRFEQRAMCSLEGGIVSVAAAFAGASLVLFAATFASPSSKVPLAIVMCLAAAGYAAASLRRDGGGVGTDTGTPGNQPPLAARSRREPLPDLRPSFLAAYGTLFCLMAWYLGFSHGFAGSIPSDPQLSALLSLCLQAAVALLAGAWLLSRLHERDGSRLLDAAAAAVLLAAVVVVFVDRDGKVALLALQQMTRGVSIMLLWLAALALANRMNLRPRNLFCLVAGGFFLCHAAGLAMGVSDPVRTFLDAFPQEGIYMFTACLAVLIAFCFATLSDLYREIVANKAPTVVLETSFIDQRCNDLAATYSLTERETEIAKLLCHGRSRAYIAESLYLSENTVKWYCRQLYQKLGIHKKQELLTLIGVE